MRRRGTAPAVAALVVLLASCGGDDPSDTATSRPSPPTSPTSPPPTSPPAGTPAPTPGDDEQPPSPEAPFPADRSRDTAEPAGESVSIVDMRFGAHEGYDRVVLEFAGDGLPGWRAEYTDDPRNQGRGDPVEIAGDAVLEVSVQGVEYPVSPGAEPYDGPETIRPGAAQVVREAQRGVLYEGYQQVFLGLTSEQPFRVFGLTDPPRVVIDVQHPR